MVTRFPAAAAIVCISLTLEGLHEPEFRGGQLRLIAEVPTIFAIPQVSLLRCLDHLNPLSRCELGCVAAAEIVDAIRSIPFLFAGRNSDGFPATQPGVIARLQSKLAVRKIKLVAGDGRRIGL